MRTRSKRKIVYLLLAAVMMSGCYSPECDPNSSEYDPDDCTNILGAFIELLTWMAYGQSTQSYEPESTCPADLICYWPDCLLVQENGSFEVEGIDDRPALWFGDKAGQTIIPVCHDDYAFEFIGTSPDGPSASASSQVFQIVDYNAAVSEDMRDVMRRIRIQASFGIFLPGDDDDTQFGIRIDAYSGTASAFPRSGDPESIPVQTGSYQRLGTVSEELLYDINGPEWQALVTELMIPAGTDFLVVFLEAFENVVNDDMFEFSNHAADRVFVAIDGGNTAPLARPDARRVPEKVETSVAVTVNDLDNTSIIDESSVVIVDPPTNGDAVPTGNGRVLYTPDSDFLGTDTFTYTVADAEGLRSNVAEVTLTVYDINEAPIAVDDDYELPPGGLLIVPVGLGVVQNDTDPDNDELMAVLVSDASNGMLNLDPTGAFTYQAGGGLTGDSFTYRATDGEFESNEATVTISAPGYDLSIEKTASPMAVTNSAPSTFTVTVRNIGTETAEDVLVQDALDVFGITLQNFTVSQGSYSPEIGQWDVGALAGGEAATLEATALIHIEHTNTATITGGLGETDNPANNDASVTVTIIE